MSRKTLPEANAVFGTGTKIAALFDPPIPHATLIRLHAEGKLPVARFSIGTWFTNLWLCATPPRPRVGAARNGRNSN